MLLGQSGQSTAEWVGLVLLVALLMVGVSVAAAGPWIYKLGDTVFGKFSCLVRGPDACLVRDGMERIYGAELARSVRDRLPDLVFQEKTGALPVDFRRCMERACSVGSTDGSVTMTATGERPTVFVHVVDRRDQGGSLYLQYWYYYTDSYSGGEAFSWPLERVGVDPERARDASSRIVDRAGTSAERAGEWLGADDTLRSLPGVTRLGARWLSGRLKGAGGIYHRHDWESVQVRIDGDGRSYIRASAHKGYSGCGPSLPPKRVEGTCQAASGAGGWVPATGWGRVSRGSHAGHVVEGPVHERVTPGRAFEIVSLDSMEADDLDGRDWDGIAPPWRKPVWRDPESRST